MPWATMDERNPCTTCINGLWRLEPSYSEMMDKYCLGCSHHNPNAKRLKWVPETGTCDCCGQDITQTMYEPNDYVDGTTVLLCNGCAANAIKKLDAWVGATLQIDRADFWRQYARNANKRDNPLRKLAQARSVAQ